MRTTVRKLIERNGMKKEDTVYGEESDEILDFQLTAGDFFEPLSGLEKGKNLPDHYRFYRCVEEYKEDNGWNGLHQQIEELHRKTVQIKKTERGENKKTGLEKLGEQKKLVRTEMREIEEEGRRRALARFGPVEELKFFEYKNRALVTSFSKLCEMAPKLADVRLAELYRIPFLVSGLKNIKEAAESGEPLGFVGGPCLFGIDEVLAEVRLRDGGSREFDCSCGRSCTRDNSLPAVGLAEYLTQYRDQVEEIRILNRKTGITRQEYISLLYLFEAAQALGGKVVVPLPDLSYIKYMESDLGPLDREMRERVMEDFKTEAFKITDIYLEVIDVLKRRYPSLETVVLHERDRELCRLFYEKREPYLRDGAAVKKLTKSDGKRDAIIDYVTMLALPYYIFGTRHVIQLDSLDETDSGRKCQKLHGTDLLLDSILYPEFLSRDGENTIYNTDIAHKDYLSREDY